jgi:hypothetical protein
VRGKLACQIKPPHAPITDILQGRRGKIAER